MVEPNCSIRFLLAHPELDVFSRPLFFMELLVILVDLLANTLLMYTLLRTALLDGMTKVLTSNNFVAVLIVLPLRWVGVFLGFWVSIEPVWQESTCRHLREQ